MTSTAAPFLHDISYEEPNNNIQRVVNRRMAQAHERDREGGVTSNREARYGEESHTEPFPQLRLRLAFGGVWELDGRFRNRKPITLAWGSGPGHR